MSNQKTITYAGFRAYSVALITKVKTLVNSLVNSLFASKEDEYDAHIATSEAYIEGLCPWIGTQAEYNALTTIDPTKLYYIIETSNNA